MHVSRTDLKWFAALACTLLPLLALSAAPIGKEERSTAEKSRKILDQAVSAEFSDQPLPDALAQLADQAKVPIILDRTALGQVGLNAELRVTTKLQHTPLRSALRRLLDPYNLGYVWLGDGLLVTTEEAALRRQLRQRVNLDLDEVPLAGALKQVARDTATNLVLDPRAAKEAQATPISLQLEDVPLETAVRLLAEVAGLKSVRVGNILFVTTEARAEKLRTEPESSLPGGPGVDMQRYWQPVAPPPMPGPPAMPAPAAVPAGPPPAGRI